MWQPKIAMAVLTHAGSRETAPQQATIGGQWESSSLTHFIIVYMENLCT
jgi:hypothetical protein